MIKLILSSLENTLMKRKTNEADSKRKSSRELTCLKKKREEN